MDIEKINKYLFATILIFIFLIIWVLMNVIFSTQFTEDFCDENYKLYNIKNEKLYITGNCLLVDELFVINDKYKIKCNRLNRKCEII